MVWSGLAHIEQFRTVKAKSRTDGWMGWIYLRQLGTLEHLAVLKTFVESPTTPPAVAGVVCACARPLWPVRRGGGGKQRWSRGHTPDAASASETSFFFLHLYFLPDWVQFERSCKVGEGLEEQSGSLTGRKIQHKR